MWTFIILVGLLVIITGFVLIFEKLVGAGGQRTITINEETLIPVIGNETALNSLSKNKIFIPSACGGKGSCGTCKFRLVDYHEPPKPTEVGLLSKEEVDKGIRLSCQTKVSRDLKIILPVGLLNAKSFKGKVINLEKMTYDIKLVRFKLDEPMHFKPGQYGQIEVPGFEEVRAYSIASDPSTPDEIEFIIRQVPNGIASTFVNQALRVNDVVKLTGPFGDFYLQENSTKPIIMIAGGSGKAPIRSIIYRLMAQGFPREATYFFGARTEKDLYLTDYFLDVSNRFPKFSYVPALSHEPKDSLWKGERGLITEVVAKLTDDLSGHEAYLCGSPGMIDACVKVLKSKGMKEENIFFDKF
ncbi:MAG: FAD-binding oxidoreductase [Acholeplasma sp.]|nr:FAD-binding oxidoreductase [Acholeplasma sp.]